MVIIVETVIMVEIVIMVRWSIWAQKGPKWSKMLGLTTLVPFGPFWTTSECVQNTETGPKKKQLLLLFWDTL